VLTISMLLLVTNLIQWEMHYFMMSFTDSLHFWNILCSKFKKFMKILCDI